MPASIHDEPTLPSTGDPAQEPYKPFQSPVVISTFNNVYCLMVCGTRDVTSLVLHAHKRPQPDREDIAVRVSRWFIVLIVFYHAVTV